MNILKKLVCAVTAAAVMASGFCASAAFTPNKNSINSEAVYLVNTDTGSVIYKQNENKKLYPASFVKIMVAVMVLEKHPDPKDIMITAPAYIFDDLYRESRGTASNAGIQIGERLSLLDLLYAMLLPSACEASSIVADYMGNGSIPDFVEQMNERAKQLGCKNTNFVNAHGLHDPEQVTSAYDMYLITKHALSLPLFKKIATTREYKMAKTNKHDEPRYIYHTNTMMSASSTYYYPYIKGIKTGTTDQSGKNLVSLGSKNGYNYMLITMGAPTVYENGSSISDNLCFIDTQNLYDWAFDNFAVKTIVEKKNSVADVKVKLSSEADHVLLVPEKDVTALLPAEADPSSVQQIADIPESLNAPIKAGQKVGTLTLKLADEVIGTVNLVSSKDISSNVFLIALNAVKNVFTSTIFKIIIILVIVLFIAYLAFIVVYNKKIKKARVRRPVKKRKLSKPKNRAQYYNKRRR